MKVIFNKVFKDGNELSFIHLNIRSVPAHFCQFKAQLDLLSLKFKVIALSETAINSYHTSYNIPGYTMEQGYRSKKREVALHCMLLIHCNIK